MKYVSVRKGLVTPGLDNLSALPKQLCRVTWPANNPHDWPLTEGGTDNVTAVVRTELRRLTDLNSVSQKPLRLPPAAPTAAAAARSVSPASSAAAASPTAWSGNATSCGTACQCSSHSPSPLCLAGAAAGVCVYAAIRRAAAHLPFWPLCKQKYLRGSRLQLVLAPASCFFFFLFLFSPPAADWKEDDFEIGTRVQFWAWLISPVTSSIGRACAGR